MLRRDGSTAEMVTRWCSSTMGRGWTSCEKRCPVFRHRFGKPCAAVLLLTVLAFVVVVIVAHTRQANVLQELSLQWYTLDELEAALLTRPRLDVIISLTSTPTRLHADSSMIRTTLASLLAQSLCPRAIWMWVPRRTRRWQSAGDEPVPEWLTAFAERSRVFRVRRLDRDFGPASKFIPTVLRLNDGYRDRDAFGPLHTHASAHAVPHNANMSHGRGGHTGADVDPVLHTIASSSSGAASASDLAEGWWHGPSPAQSVLVVDDDYMFASDLLAVYGSFSKCYPHDITGILGFRIQHDVCGPRWHNDPARLHARPLHTCPTALAERAYALRSWASTAPVNTYSDLGSTVLMDVFLGSGTYLLQPRFFNATDLVDYGRGDEPWARAAFLEDDYWMAIHAARAGTRLVRIPVDIDVVRRATFANALSIDGASTALSRTENGDNVNLCIMIKTFAKDFCPDAQLGVCEQ